MISLQGISKYIGDRALFADVSFHIHAGERIGVVGPNGAGKSTLFQVLLGKISPDDGQVNKSKLVRIGYLPQQWTPIQGRSVLSYVLDVSHEIKQLRARIAELEERLRAEVDSPDVEKLAFELTHQMEELERLGGYDLEARARKILAGLGFRDNELERPTTQLSGGWLMRLELARLLLEEPDLLLLDEPTNHLDLESLLWLENYLMSTRSAVMLVSHDRAFLNRLVRRIVELEGGRFEEYTGNYDAYVTEKKQRREMLLAARKNQQDQIRQIERFIARNRYRKDRARQVQSRIRALEKIDQVELPEYERTVHFKFPASSRTGKRVFELEGVRKTYGDVTVYEGIDLVVERGDRIAFLGTNGAGKSTLLKILAGVEPITGGEKRPGHGVQLGYYAQHQWEQLDPGKSVLEEAVSVSGDLTQSQVRGLLGAFLFPGDDVDKRVVVLSGGEKARLALCKLLMQRPNVLLLDEPTNHLDIPSREVLERALGEFAGTICFISHDRQFINAIASKVLVVHGGQPHLFPGNYDDFQQIWSDRLFANEAVSTDRETADPDLSAGDQEPDPRRKFQDRKRLEAQWRNELYRLKRPRLETLERIEADLEKVQHRLDQLGQELAAPETYQDGARVQDLQIAYRNCQEEVERLSTDWEERSLELEALEEQFWIERQG